jgi:hypothetical protein
MELEPQPPRAWRISNLSAALDAVVTATLTGLDPTLDGDPGLGLARATLLPRRCLTNTKARAPRFWSLASSCLPRLRRLQISCGGSVACRAGSDDTATATVGAGPGTAESYP